jgi:hypothetical protein
MIQPSSRPFEMIERLDVQRGRSCCSVCCQSGPMPRALITASKSAPAAMQDAVVAVELAVGEPEPIVGARVEPAAIVAFWTARAGSPRSSRCRWRCGRRTGSDCRRGRRRRLAGFEPVVERAQVTDRRAIEARRRRLRAERVEPKYQVSSSNCDYRARPAGSGRSGCAAHAPERVDKLDRGAADRLVDAALERRLVVEPRRVSQSMPNSPSL